jgi:hypothetical protein
LVVDVVNAPFKAIETDQTIPAAVKAWEHAAASSHDPGIKAHAASQISALAYERSALQQSAHRASSIGWGKVLFGAFIGAAVMAAIMGDD